MKQRAVEKQFVTFVTVCLIALVLTFVGLRLYFNDNRLGLLLTQTYTASDFNVLSGQARRIGDDLLVDSTQPDNLSVVAVESLRVDSDLYEFVAITFTEKHIQQPLSVVFYGDSGEQNQQPILYTNQLSTRLRIDDTFADNVLLRSIALQTDNLLSPYRIHSLRFEPKQLNFIEFARLLASSFVINPRWQQDSLHSQRSTMPIIGSSKLLLLMYFAVCGVLFSLYLSIRKQSLSQVWWIIGIVAWLVLDMHYLVGKTHTTLHHDQRLRHLVDQHTTNDIPAAHFTQLDVPREVSIANSFDIVSVFHVVMFVAALFLPCLLGFAALKPFLKKRYGYRALALGAGYFLGWWLMIAVMKFSDHIHYALSKKELLLIIGFISLILFLFKAKPCAINELRLEKAPSNLTYLLSLSTMLLLLYRWGLTLVGSLNNSKAFVGAMNGDESLNMVALIHQYVVFAWGAEHESVVNLPWVGVSIALFSLAFGGLRYLGVRLLPAILTGYLIVSLPLWDTHVSVGNGVEVWSGLGFLSVTLLLVIILIREEWRLLMAFFMLLVATYFTQYDTLLFLLALAVVVVWRVLGGIVVTVLMIILFVGLQFGGEWLHGQSLSIAQQVLMSVQSSVVNNTNMMKIIGMEWLVLDNWHYIFTIVLGSLLMLLSHRMHHRQSTEFMLLIIAGVTSWSIMLALVFFNSSLSNEALVSYLNRTTLVFIPVFSLIPVCVYQLINHDEETIPMI